ncbi:Pantoate-beta-alanine ligase [Suillus clintonianus]|uniref:Pantoate-beta-alanine ligase n=1 Tax=Suillus clintonianus TaxID=1904413 RepID=UPI001B861F07|nr:Pantoate-beta-alanine ligase [Suillus clintonianus]KAG2128607.1 Pantoate-beta-alanine ligase [Suillus clintonianus]
MTSSSLPPSPIPLLTSVASYRQWRQRAFDERKSVGFVPTMGALHDGHLSLVQKSLAENELTVLSIFVNPAQFAPHEDLATYPRTLPGDLELLTAQQVTVGEAVRKASAVFLPSVQDMYPSGISQDVSAQRGAFIEMKGYGHQMEGASRPNFFRGVATVVTKLFNAVQPTNAYFGQKDIQQALLLRKLCKDLLFPHPEADHVHIVPTSRDPNDGLALSSRNAYLSANERKFAPALYKALQYAESAWSNGESKDRCISRALAIISEVKAQAVVDGVDVRLDYIEMNDSETFDVLDASSNNQSVAGDIPMILSGALWVGKTRLIDNIVVGDLNRIII